MKLSFVIPAYNEEMLLPKCLMSVLRELRESGREAEVIVVNNASTDKTKEVALQFPGVSVVDEPTKGLVAARAAGFKVATGDIIANIDADTMLTPGWIEKVFVAFGKDERLVGLSGPFVYYDLSWASRLLVRIFYFFAYLTHTFNQHVVHVGAVLQGGNFVIRKAALERVGGFDTSITFYGEDTDVAKRLSKAGKICWTFRFPIYASGRRLRKEGLVVMSLRYTLNYFWVTFAGRPFSKEHIDIRSKTD